MRLLTQRLWPSEPRAAGSPSSEGWPAATRGGLLRGLGHGQHSGGEVDEVPWVPAEGV